eukprot:scaffold7585_cov243-Skeletonema_marinoi.AAC.4
MANCNVSLDAVDCHIHSVRYDMVLNSSAGGLLRRPNQITYDKLLIAIFTREIRHGARVALAAVPNWASSRHLRCCSDADTTIKCLSRREIRHGARVALAAVPNWASSGHLRRCSDADTTNRSLSRVKDASILSWPTVMCH